MKRVLLMMLVATSAFAFSCSTATDQKAHDAISAYLRKQVPSYEPVSFRGGYRWTRKDSARFEDVINYRHLKVAGMGVSSARRKENQDSLERRVLLSSIKDTTYIGKRFVHIFKVNGKVDSARFAVYNTGEVWQIWPNSY